MKLHVIICVLLEAVLSIYTVFGHKTNSIQELMSSGNPSEGAEPVVWVTWNSSLHSVPENAVAGGYDSDNATVYVIRMHIWSGSVYMGIMPGRYTPSKGLAVYSFRGQQYTSMFFDVLTGKDNYLWGDYIENPSVLILGGWDISYNRIYICRDHSRTDVMMPGKYEYGKCLYLLDGVEYESHNWTILRSG